MSLILGNELPDRAMNYLQVGRLVILSTVDERGWPDAAPISWITALDRRTLRLAVSPQVSTYRNILKNERVALELIGGAMTLGISGRAHVITESIEAVPFPMAMVEVIVDEVKDDSVIGRGAEGEPIRWEDRRRSVSDIRVENALRNTPSPALSDGVLSYEFE
jgi:predicted pyridoxine 5'-phosphate oxidase superfamily flavin-nucleotide-binding protein